MKKNTLSKRILLIVFSMVLCFAISTTAYAEEKSSLQNNSTLSESSLVITPMSFATLLQIGPWYGFTGKREFTIYVESNHNLTAQIMTTGSELTIQAKKVGDLFYKSVTAPPDGAVHTYKILSNCSGGNYSIIVRTNGIADCVAYISQTEFN